MQGKDYKGMKVLRFFIYITLLHGLYPSNSPAAETRTNSPVRTNAPVRTAAPSSGSNAPAGFSLQPGFRMELVASEPMVVAPVAMAFDEKGRLFIAEMPDLAAGP